MNSNILLANFFDSVAGLVIVCAVIFIAICLGVVIKCFVKIEQGRALVRTGMGETKVSFSGMLVFPVIHRKEIMDISLKRIEIERTASNGLVCKDNIRADIKVAFFIRVNPVVDDVKRVAQSIGCARASAKNELEALFDPKFSEALKTVGKRFDFIELYEERDTFRDEIVKVIGRDLNGFVLDDASIDYLEQTPLSAMNPDNILDAEGIRKITDLTAQQQKLTNHIERDKQRVIKQQDVEAREAILELERQLAETEAKQAREVATVQSREKAEATKVAEEQRLKSEQARIATEEELQIAEQNKDRQVLVAQRNKERTDAVETERVIRDRELEVIERERLTALKDIEKTKAVETEQRNIQEVIKERVAVEKTVVEEMQKMLDIEAFAGAERQRSVAVTLAEKDAAEAAVKRVKAAEAEKESAQLHADQEAYQTVKFAGAAKEAAEMHAQEIIITADANQAAAEKQADAKKKLAEGTTAESAAVGIAEAKVQELKFAAEAQGITQKAEAMKLFEEAGQGHEEFKLKLEKEKAVDLAQINVQRDIAAEQAKVVGEALRSAKIDIVGGESQFFDKITQSITAGKAIDRTVDNSQTLTNIRDTFFNGDPEYFKTQMKSWVDQFGITTEDLKNLSVSGVLGKILSASPDKETTTAVRGLLAAADRFGLADEKAAKLLK
jgi:flotillin